MNYLDELKEKVKEQEAKEEAQFSTSQIMMEKTHQIIVPKLREMYTALSELRRVLVKLRPTLSMSYEVSNIATFRDLLQDDYVLWSNPGEEDDKFTFQYAYSRPGSLNYRLDKREDAESDF